jgi:hypothetical protein
MTGGLSIRGLRHSVGTGALPLSVSLAIRDLVQVGSPIDWPVVSAGSLWAGIDAGFVVSYLQVA